jgi:hypothetical protein
VSEFNDKAWIADFPGKFEAKKNLDTFLEKVHIFSNSVNFSWDFELFVITLCCEIDRIRA